MKKLIYICHPSEGMQAEIELAKAHGIPIRDGERILKERSGRCSR